jgi:hypothetical protein
VQSKYFSEFSHIDTLNCDGEDIFDPYARADHVFESVFYDTVTAPFWIGNNTPLGLRIHMTSYAFMHFCPRVVWVQLHVTNVGQHALRNLWFGVNSRVYVDARTNDFGTEELQGRVGFEHDREFEYFFSQSGRLPGDTSVNDFRSDAAVGIIPLVNRANQSISFNWWLNSFEDSSFGPAWESHADRDSLGMGWTATAGLASNDLQRYQLMTNREQDFDLLRMSDSEWINQHTPPTQRWSSSSFELTYWDVFSSLISAGPYGVNEDGNLWLRPGESTDIWFAVFGAQGFHDMNHPQEGDLVDPDLYDLSGLLDAALIAGESPCFEYLPVGERPGNSGMVEKFAFRNAYPNPFNSSVDLIFESPVGQFAEVQVMDILGREIETVYSGITPASETRIRWQPKDLSSGVYFARLTGKGEVAGTQKLLFLK